MFINWWQTIELLKIDFDNNNSLDHHKYKQDLLVSVDDYLEHLSVRIHFDSKHLYIDKQFSQRKRFSLSSFFDLHLRNSSKMSSRWTFTNDFLTATLSTSATIASWTTFKLTFQYHYFLMINIIFISINQFNHWYLPHSNCRQFEEWIVVLSYNKIVDKMLKLFKWNEDIFSIDVEKEKLLSKAWNIRSFRSLKISNFASDATPNITSIIINDLQNCSEQHQWLTFTQWRLLFHIKTINSSQNI